MNFGIDQPTDLAACMIIQKILFHPYLSKQQVRSQLLPVSYTSLWE